MSKNNSVNYKGWQLTFEIIDSDRIEIVKGEPVRSFFPLSSKVPDTLLIPREIKGYTVSRIGEEAFRLSPDKTPYNIILPDTVEYIGKRAFASCQNLRSLILPYHLKEIGNHAFSQCKNLKTVSVSSMPDIKMNHSILKIKECAFWGCSQLTDFDVKTIISIDNHSFWKCESLESIFISEEVAEIADNAFEDCQKLVIYCTKNSYISQYAIKHNIEFKYYGNIQSQNIKIQITPDISSQIIQNTENHTNPTNITTDNKSDQIVQVPREQKRIIKTFYKLSQEDLLLLNGGHSDISCNTQSTNIETPQTSDTPSQIISDIKIKHVVKIPYASKRIIRTFYKLSQEDLLLFS